MIINSRTSVPAHSRTAGTISGVANSASAPSERKDPTDSFDWAAKREYERWHRRLRSDMGVLTTPPVGAVEASHQKASDYLFDLIDRLAGPDLTESDIDLRIELFSGDIPQAAIDDSDKMEKNWKQYRGDRRWPIREWMGVPDAHGDKAIYRLAINVGMLQALDTEDELAFVLSQQLERALDHDKQDPYNEDTIGPNTRSFVNSRYMQVPADKAAIKRMSDAGFNPRAAFSALNKLYAKNPIDYPDNDLERALTAAAHDQEAEGIRVGAVETEVENYVRRGETSVHREMTPMPSVLKIEARPEYNKPVDDIAKFKAN